MPIHWDDIEILRVLDERERGVRSGLFDGFELMQAIAAERGAATTDADVRSFLRELFALGDAKLLTWELTQIPPHVRQLDPHDAQNYLQNMHDPTLTIPGRDRAQGRVILTPLPDPTEDNGRSIATLTMEDVAKCIDRKYAPHQAVQLLIEGGISPEHDQGEEGETWEKLFVIFVTLERGVSGQRRELRHFVGAWLDDRLRIGPSEQERERIEPDLERQGWFVKNGRLVPGEPIRKRRDSPPAPALDQLHPVVWNAADPQWKVKHFRDAVDDAGKAVNAMLQAKVGRNDASESPLVESTFSPHPPKAGEPRLRFPDIVDARTRDSVTAGVQRFGVGCFKAIRNPLGHLPSEQHDITAQEALEQLAAWSQFARWIERTEVEEAHT